MSYLLDTNVILEIRKGPRGNESVAGWFAAHRESGFYLSSMVTGEIRKGIERLRFRDSSGAANLDQWLDETYRRFEGRIIPVSDQIAEEWGRLSAENPPPIVDGLIAATAKVHGLTLVTRNVADIERTGVRCLNPFD